MLVSIMLLTFALPMAVIVLSLVGSYKLFEKAGLEGWKGLIPFYNKYVMATEICGLNMWWGICAIVGALIPVIGSVVVLVASININYCLAKKLNQDEAGIILTCIIPNIMYCVFGFGNAEFVNVDLPEHGLFQSVFESSAPQQSTKSRQTTTTTGPKFCSNCGYKLDKKDKFCENCGSEIK